MAISQIKLLNDLNVDMQKPSKIPILFQKKIKKLEQTPDYLAIMDLSNPLLYL